MADPQAGLPRAYFTPRPLENLALADELESLDPIIDSKVLNLLPNSDTPQIFAACGRGARSSMRILRHGLEVEESVSSDLPGIPNAVWTTKRTEDGKRLHFSHQQNHINITIKSQTRTTPTSSSPL
jgi:splicing factor 3B subunit 3